MAQNLRQRSDLENGSTEALSESRTTLSEWQTDPELKFYGRAMLRRSSASFISLSPFSPNTH